MVDWQKWSAIATFSAAAIALVVAVFPSFWSSLRSERPDVRVLDALGVETTVSMINLFGEGIERNARYFHLKIRKSWWSRRIIGLHVAWRELQVMSPTGELWDHWRGILPLRWRQEDFDRSRIGKDIGPEWHADLFSVFDEHPGGLTETSAVHYAWPPYPKNFPAEITVSHQVRALLEARSDQGLSKWYELRFSWSKREPRPHAIIFEETSSRSLD